MKKLLGLFAFGVISAPVQSHYIWLQQDSPQEVKVFFGEWENNRTEQTGGNLDKIRAEVIVPSGMAADISRQSDHVSVQLKKPGDVGLIEEMAPRNGRNSDAVTRTVMLAVLVVAKARHY